MTQAPDLIHYADDQPGIRRERRGRGFSYIAPDGTRINCARERKRINALAVPPAYENVWISPKVNGHLQATGRDVRQRKQYRYHADWTAFRALTKFDALADFGAMLPRIRRRVRRDLKEDVGTKDYAIAALLALLDRAAIRVGTADYAAENGTYGATTLKPRHLNLKDGEIRLSYTGKGGKKIRKRLRDQTLNRALNRLQDLPGAELVSWVDDTGAAHSITADAINATLYDITDDDRLTAKTFRTWAGTVAAFDVALRDPDLTIKSMADAAASRLANTPTIARNSYIHPDVIALTDMPAEDRAALIDPSNTTADLRQSETALLHLLSR
ncbi:DNA topoisomerase IB [Pseudooctadecabacter jejudonensis]|uniref:DNA topoisomerase n=1 Tax=Pseudooctadecabacter jejudonensis TaxID=1391910 RepID=A0A1Y5SC41_9RHOB|nr:DNA topoisomerase IB [Pseudooctadecabacter jejudonensis]SLN34570.1 Eukaryotic DNA topoisomerase I, catalytic core [Pseudooctadecabacter jejudonensis]